jgi:hypothetical protein
MSKEETVKNTLLENLLSSNLEESLEFGSLLLNSESIPEEEREPYIKELIKRYLKEDVTLSSATINNMIEAYNKLTKDVMKNRIHKL